MISLVGYFDLLTGYELSFSFFYLIPISFFAISNQSTKINILIAALYSALLWFAAEFFSRPYSSTFFPLWNAIVRFSIFSAIGLLIFSLKEKQKKLNIINSTLETLNSEKNKIIGIAAHDLRNPIWGIQAFSEILLTEKKEFLQANIAEDIKIINELSLNTSQILENLLDVHKIESGRVELKTKEVDYIEFIKKQIEFNKVLASNKNIHIIFETTDDNISGEYDIIHLTQAFDNLISNAIKYSHPNSKILVKVSCKKNQHILTEVIDEGEGISEEYQKKLFNYFQKADSKPTAGEKSTGLGLAIAKHMIKIHGGEIGFRSNKGKGSNFYFTLPIK
jgi:signal transduction histidine kinase